MISHIKTVIFTLTVVGLMFSAEKQVQIIDTYKDGNIYGSSTSQNQSREITIHWEEDFESGENGWSFDAGWELTQNSYHSATHSAPPYAHSAPEYAHSCQLWAYFAMFWAKCGNLTNMPIVM